MFSAQGGVLVYAGGARAANRLRWIARSGAPLGYVGQPGAYFQLAIAPGEKEVALNTAGDLWLLDLTTGVLSQLTSDLGIESDPTWSPDGRRVAFTAWRTGPGTIFQKDLTTGIEEQLLPNPPTPAAVVDDWSPDGQSVIFRNMGPRVFALPMTGERKPRLIAETQGADSVHLSPNGRWVAFTDSASGRAELVDRALPGIHRQAASIAGGRHAAHLAARREGAFLSRSRCQNLWRAAPGWRVTERRGGRGALRNASQA